MRRLAASLLLSRTGDQLTTIALLWFVLDLTRSSVAVGLVVLCAGLPPVVTGPLLGRLLDRWSLRRVMFADNLARAALVAAIPTLHWLDRLNLPLIYGLSLAAGALLPATDVGVRVALPRLVDQARLEHGNTLLSIGDQVGALVGPAVGAAQLAPRSDEDAGQGAVAAGAGGVDVADPVHAYLEAGFGHPLHAAPPGLGIGVGQCQAAYAA